MTINKCLLINTNGGNKEQKFTWGQKPSLVLGLSFVTSVLLGNHLTLLSLSTHL